MLVLKYRDNSVRLRDEIKEVEKDYIIKDIIKNEYFNSPRRDLYFVSVHRVSYAKHLRSQKRLKNKKQLEMIIPEWFLRDQSEDKPDKTYKSKSLKPIAGENNAKYEKEIAKEMLHLY